MKSSLYNRDKRFKVVQDQTCQTNIFKSKERKENVIQLIEFTTKQFPRV